MLSRNRKSTSNSGNQSFMLLLSGKDFSNPNTLSISCKNPLYSHLIYGCYCCYYCYYYLHILIHSFQTICDSGLTLPTVLEVIKTNETKTETIFAQQGILPLLHILEEPWKLVGKDQQIQAPYIGRPFCYQANSLSVQLITSVFTAVLKKSTNLWFWRVTWQMQTVV